MVAIEIDETQPVFGKVNVIEAAYLDGVKPRRRTLTREDMAAASRAEIS